MLQTIIRNHAGTEEKTLVEGENISLKDEKTRYQTKKALFDRWKSND